MARGRTIAAAIVRSAEMRAAFKNLARNSDVRLAGVVAVCLRAAARIFRNAADLRRVGLMLGRKPVAGPLPDVADHVVDAIADRRKRRHRRGTPEARPPLVRKFAVPRVGHRAIAGHELITPRKVSAVESTA